MRVVYSKLFQRNSHLLSNSEEIGKLPRSNIFNCANLVNCGANQIKFHNKIGHFASRNAKKMSAASGISSGDGVAGAGNPVIQPASAKKTVRNVQTQHGDYRSVDEENIVLVKSCIWLEGIPVEDAAAKSGDEGEASSATDGPVSTSDEPSSASDEPEQVVWIEPFDEVSSIAPNTLIRNNFEAAHSSCTNNNGRPEVQYFACQLERNRIL